MSLSEVSECYFRVKLTYSLTSLYILQKCKDCKGRGWETCDECDGWGRVECDNCGGCGRRSVMNAEGEHEDQDCPWCQGGMKR